MLLALTLLGFTALADPQIATVDEAWPRRDQATEAAELQALADAFAASQDYEKLWRASRWYAWLAGAKITNEEKACLLYTSPSPRDRTRSRMPSSA